MLKKGEHIEGTPTQLQALLDKDEEANAFFESLSKSYKQGYCDWVGSAKQEETRERRVKNACSMLATGKRRPCCFDRSGFYDKSLSAPKAAT